MWMCFRPTVTRLLPFTIFEPWLCVCAGWKLVHGDVFRPPRHLELLAALIGTGVQLSLLILCVILITIAGMRNSQSLLAPRPVSCSPQSLEMEFGLGKTMEYVELLLREEGRAWGKSTCFGRVWEHL